MSAAVDEIAPDVFRISTYIEAADFQFNQFLLRDDEPLLYHAGQLALFPGILAAIKQLIDVKTLRWIGFSHFEADECGALNRWLEIAPRATALAGVVAAATSITDFALRPPRVLQDDEGFSTGRHHLRFLATPHVPHNWEASLLCDETTRTLFCSDLCVQHGRRPVLADDVLQHATQDLRTAQQGPFRNATPYNAGTTATMARLAALQPETLAIMHGASFHGDGAAVLRGFDAAMADVLVAH